jgi:hypothetical protein
MLVAMTPTIFAEEMAALAGQRVHIESEERPFYFGNVARDGVRADYLAMHGDDGVELMIPFHSIGWCAFDGSSFTLRLLTPLPRKD